MAEGTILQQGRFTSDGSNKQLAIRSDVDWIRVYNYTNIGTTNNPGEGYKFEWFRGFEQGDALIMSNTAGAATLEMDKLGANGGGFELLNTAEDPVLSSSRATTAATDATQPVVSTGDTSGLATGSIVRLSNTADATSLNGIDFEVDNIVANTSFRIRYAMDRSPGVAGGAGKYRIVKRDPIFYPRRRFIANMTQASQAVITTTVSHGFNVGESVRLKVPEVNDETMTEVDGQKVTIVATTASTITIDLDTSGFTAFNFPQPEDYPFTAPQVIPVGTDTAESLLQGVSEIASASENQAILGIQLGSGDTGPAGANNDVIYWVAGKSYKVDNQ